MFGPPEFPAAAITNIDDNGEVLSDEGHDTVKSIRGNEAACDSTYMPVQAFGAVVSAEVVPPDKAPTGFADMRAAFADLDDDTDHVESLCSKAFALLFARALGVSADTE